MVFSCAVDDVRAKRRFVRQSIVSEERRAPSCQPAKARFEESDRTNLSTSLGNPLRPYQKRLAGSRIVYAVFLARFSLGPAWTITVRISPNESTARCRCRPVVFFPVSKPRSTPVSAVRSCPLRAFTEPAVQIVRSPRYLSPTRITQELVTLW